MSYMKINIEQDINITVPRVPNFILTPDPNVKYSIADFDDEQLKAIGQRWTDDLLKRSKEIRKHGFSIT